jgi:hypothetical protein
LRRLADERGLALNSVRWLSEADADTFTVGFSMGDQEYAAPIVREDLEYAGSDEAVRSWLADHLKKAAA